MKDIIKKWIKVIVCLFKQKEMIPIPTTVNMGELLKGKIALVTGGSSGIGLAIAKEFIQNGGKVVIAGTNENKLLACAKDINKPNQLKTIVIDVRDIELLDQKVQEAANLFPEQRIDILVNSAGLVTHSNFWNMRESEYDAIMDTNVKGTFFVSQAVAKYMISKQVKGHILHLSSSSSLRPAWTPYEMSKWAINGFTKGLADQLLPHGIVVNAIAPGPTATPMLGRKPEDTLYNEICPAGRYAMPEEIAHLAAFMVSSCADLVIGDTFYMTGGSGTISYHR